MEQPLLVLSNVPDASVAQDLARHVVALRLAACVNILPGVQSIYQWQGKVEVADEVTLFIKTTTALYPELEAAIKARHPYDVPEIIALPIVDGLPAYLAWIMQETVKDVNV
ncbi:MAG: divalent-cation tolerance protein CutA [Herminiimonas sp.]|nr:divalent-cation tolerance protein CutA [Herminiimonas sp.]